MDEVLSRRRVLTGQQAGERVAKASAEQAEIARLRRVLDRAERRLATTETALVIMGEAHALLEQICESAKHDERRGKRYRGTYAQFIEAGVTTDRGEVDRATALDGDPPTFT